jgi:hypothetical protein
MSEGAIFKAIPAIMSEIGAIAKNRTNVSQNYKFRGIDDVYNVIHDLFIKYKVFTVPEILEEKDDSVPSKTGGTLFYARLKIKYTFYAEDGSFVTAIVRGEGMDSGDKASNKAMAVAHKYALIQTFAIPTEDGDDPENESPEVKVTAVVDSKAVARHDMNEAYEACSGSGLFTPDELASMLAEGKKHKENGPSMVQLVTNWRTALASRHKPIDNDKIPF